MTQSSPEILQFPRRAPLSVESAATVLVVTSDSALADRMTNELSELGFVPKRSPTTEAALHTLGAIPTDVCLLGPLASTDSVAGFASQITNRGWSTQVLQLMPEPASGERLISLNGIEGCPWPTADGMLHAFISAAAHRARLTTDNRRLKRQLANRNLREMTGHSPAMQTLRQQVQLQADQMGSLLICGEPGTGVELVAQSLHEASRRAHRPFIRVDCRVLSAELLDEELWGPAILSINHDVQRPPTRLQLAEGGTVFLDGIETVALPVQRRILNLVKNGRYEHPVTGEQIRCDVRVLVGTTAKLEQQAEAGLFRTDLWEALHTRMIEVPSLRDRSEDIAAIVEACLQRIAYREGRPVRALTVDALNVLKAQRWSGNVRELENVVDRAASVDWGTRLTVEMLEPWLAANRTADELQNLPGMTLAEMERKLIEATFERFAGNRELTAGALQIGIRTLSGKLRDYGYPPRGGPGSNRLQPAAVKLQPAADEGYESRAA